MWWEATSVTIKVRTSLKKVLLVRVKPDHQLQRWQRVHRHQGVQQALVLVQLINRNIYRLINITYRNLC